MAEREETKICPLCAETIKAAAKVCPCCGSRQRGSGLQRGQVSGVLVLIASVVGIFALFSWLSPNETDKLYSPFFPQHRHELAVARTSLESPGKGLDMWLSGYITNAGSRSWRVHELEVRVLDSRGAMIDVQHPEFGQSEAFVV